MNWTIALLIVLSLIELAGIIFIWTGISAIAVLADLTMRREKAIRSVINQMTKTTSAKEESASVN